MTEHPFIKAIADLPTRFPELSSNDQLAQIARLVVIPNLKIAAKKDPDAIRAATVKFLSRFVVGLGIRPEEIYAGDELTAVAPADARAEKLAAPLEPPPANPDLDRVLAGEDI